MLAENRIPRILSWIDPIGPVPSIRKYQLMKGVKCIFWERDNLVLHQIHFNYRNDNCWRRNTTPWKLKWKPSRSNLKKNRKLGWILSASVLALMENVLHGGASMKLNARHTLNLLKKLSKHSSSSVFTAAFKLIYSS